MPDLCVAGADLEPLAAEILQGGNSLRFRVRGASMRPFIKDGDLAEVWPTSTSDLRRGDVVLCRHAGGRLVVHRVVRVRRKNGRIAVVTRGDLMAQPDGSVPAHDVLGRAVAVEREGRRIALDRGLHRLLGLLWTSSSPLSQGLYRGLAALRREVRAALARKPDQPALGQ